MLSKMNKKGSATVLISMISVAIIVAMMMSINMTRRIAVKSECEAYGHTWQRAILSEYDVHLFDDYGIFAYQGSDAEVADKITGYAQYSMAGKLKVKLDKSEAELSEYTMSNPDNFRYELRKNMTAKVIKSIYKGGSRHRRSDDESQENRVIRNEFVIDTLQSTNYDDKIDVDRIISELEKGDIIDSITDAGATNASEYAFIRKYLNNHLTYADDKESFFSNEWEYIISGKLSDEDNFKSCKNKIFMIRNALNLVALYKDPTRVEIVTAAAEVITPGPMGVLTQAVIMEAWAALEAQEDVKKLLDGGRVPAIKKSGEWIVGFEKVLSSRSLTDELDDDSIRNLKDEESQLGALGELDNVKAEFTDGQTYEDYLLLMIMIKNSDTRTLRIMDLVQINIKLRYYRDFNLAEYYCGTAFSIKANGRVYSYEDKYQ